MKNEMQDFIANSKLKTIIGDKRNFIGSKVEYAHDKDREIYSIKLLMRRGEEYIVTLTVGENSVEMALSDRDGNILEHMLHEGENLVYG